MNGFKNEQFTITIDDKKWLFKQQNHFEKSLLLFVTGKCNLNCTNCFSQSTRSDLEMSSSQIEKLLIANPTFHRIDLMGGEPLMHSHITEILDLLSKYNKRTTVYTNGLLLPILNGYSSIRVCVSFHEIQSANPSRKPLISVQKHLSQFVKENNSSLKLVLLIDKGNADHVLSCINYVEQQLPFISTLTIGLMRNENDYWNDTCSNVIPFAEYASIIQRILDSYNGKLNLDIFSKGVLCVNGDNQNTHIKDRTNRFKCVFPDMTFSDCLYSACSCTHPQLSDSFLLPDSYSICKHTNRYSCLADKIRLRRVQ